MKRILMLLSVLIVALFLIGCVEKEETEISDDSTLTGEASLLPRQCTDLTRSCGFIGKGALKEPVLVTFNTIKEFYGDDSAGFQYTKKPSEICSDMGYKGCFAGQVIGFMNFFESTDGSCTKTQYEDDHYELVACSEGGKHTGPCNNRLTGELTEPVYGDNNYYQLLVGVICFN